MQRSLVAAIQSGLNTGLVIFGSLYGISEWREKIIYEIKEVLFCCVSLLIYWPQIVYNKWERKAKNDEGKTKTKNRLRGRDPILKRLIRKILDGGRSWNLCLLRDFFLCGQEGGGNSGFDVLNVICVSIMTGPTQKEITMFVILVDKVNYISSTKILFCLTR